MYVRGLLVHVQNCRHDILPTECAGKVFQIVVAPSIKPALVGDTFRILMHFRELPQGERLIKLNQIAIQQMKVLEGDNNGRKLLQ